MAVVRKGFSKILKRLYDSIDNVGKLGAMAAVTGMTVTEDGFGANRKTIFTFTAAPLALIDAAGVVARTAPKIYDFPIGSIKIGGAVANLALTKSSAGVNTDWDGDFSVGTAPAAADATLTATEANIIPSTATPQAVAGATTAKGRNAADIAPFDGAAAVTPLYLNFLVDDADQDVTTTPCNLIVNGTLTVHWTNFA